MREHTEIGAQIIEDIKTAGDYNDFLDMSDDIARYHHENWDGSGYPHGKAGNDIPLSAQIVALMSAYNAMTEKRAYREAFTKEEALQSLRSLVQTDGICASESIRAILDEPNLASANPGFVDRMIVGEYAIAGSDTYSCEKSFRKLDGTVVLG